VALGALHRIDTEARTIEEGGIAFVVRRAKNLERKQAEVESREEDPFAAPEPELFVADLSPTHYALLNKYNVLDRHLLVVTRDYVDQEALLDESDFEALVLCMQDQPVLGFYNGGKVAGASQPHKHLQVVRLPLAHGRDLPIEALMGDATSTVPRLPVRHAFMRIDADEPATLFAGYRRLLDAADVGGGPYNLLVAHDWMLVIPRKSERFESIGVNALAFAGALFVRGDEEMKTVERVGPMAVLRGVAYPKDFS